MSTTYYIDTIRMSQLYNINSYRIMSVNVISICLVSFISKHNGTLNIDVDHYIRDNSCIGK